MPRLKPSFTRGTADRRETGHWRRSSREKQTPRANFPSRSKKISRIPPGYGYIPSGESLYTGWNDGKEKDRPIFDIDYKESIFIGYRWYENKKIEPLYPFGYGLSDTSFEYSDLNVSKEEFNEHDTVTVTFSIKNVGKSEGAEIAQLYIEDVQSSLPRPIKELKGFKRVSVEPGQAATVRLQLTKEDFSYWNPKTKGWYAEKGKFIIHVGSSSKEIRLQKTIELL